MKTILVPTNYYNHHDADYALDVPAEGFGGWKRETLPLDPDRTAVIVMHAWDCGKREDVPGWFRCVEYIPRSYDICRAVLPPLLEAVRGSGMKLYHVVRPGSHYFRDYEGYRRAAGLAGEVDPPKERVEQGETWRQLQRFKREHVFPGLHNEQDIARGQKSIDFPAEARPVGDEGIAESSEQLFALCKADGIDHLIYTGFAINGCLMTSPGGMVDMQRRGLLCSAVRQAVTAIENKETAREERAKDIALWEVALLYGFVYDAADLIEALAAGR